ncbi:cell division ATP-binding protein FtsE [Candidatus Poribacteria bacterium]|nr:cell division ATP-binding protein FtsE [Candidatus Poribacteria bacterium]
MSAQPIIQIEHVTMRYGRHEPVLNDVSCDILPGEFVFIVGASGAGKTTLLRLLFRDLLPTKGRVVIGGQDIDSLRPRQLAHFRRRVGVVFQDFKLLPHRTVHQNVSLALRVARKPRREIREAVDRMLTRVSLTHRRDGIPEEISGGEQQRVAIARAMVGNPAILLADEPTGNLDHRLASDIYDLFEGFNLRGTTVLIATHDLSSAVERGKRVIRIDRGTLREGLA